MRHKVSHAAILLLGIKVPPQPVDSLENLRLGNKLIIRDRDYHMTLSRRSSHFAIPLIR
jgi:hypothetical protein